MPILLALAIQTAPVSTPSAEAAMKCGNAVIVASGEPAPSLRTTSHFMYFVMQAAKEAPGGKPYLERVNELASGAPKEESTAAEAAKTLAACDRSYPLARATMLPRLPANAFDRDMLCLGALSILRGAAEEMRGIGPDGGAAARIDAALKPLVQRFDGQALAAHGIADDAAFVSALGEQLKASLALGNSQTIGRACGVTGI